MRILPLLLVCAASLSFAQEAPVPPSAQTSGAITAIEPTADPTVFTLRTHLVVGQGAHPQSIGDVYFPLPTALAALPLNNASRISAQVRVSAEFTRSPLRPHRARLILKDGQDRRMLFPNIYIVSRPESGDGWLDLEGYPSTDIPIPLGFTEPGFDITQVVSMGLSIEAGDRDAEIVDGTIELRNLKLEPVAAVVPQDLPLDPAIQAGEPARAAAMEQRISQRRGADWAQEPLFGVNLAWAGARAPDGKFLQLYGNYLHAPEAWYGEHWDLRNPTVERAVREDFARIRGMFGVKSLVRTFLFTTGRNYLVLDAAGMPTAWQPVALQNLKRMLDIAHEENVLMMPVIFDFLIAADFVSQFSQRDPDQRFVELFTVPEKRARLVALIEELVRPLANHPAVLVWDVMNEPENATRLVTRENFLSFQTFLKEAVDAIHRAGELATIGHRNIIDPAAHTRGRIATDFGQAHWYPRMEGRPNPHSLNTSPRNAFGVLPSGWGEAPARERYILADYTAAFSAGHRYFMFWDWRGDDEGGDGFRVRAHEAEIQRSIARLQRRRINALPPVPVVFTMDDIPMWYVWEQPERLAAYARYTEVLSSHAITPAFFVNPGYLRSAEEWAQLAQWQERGWLIANHGATHRHIGRYGLESVVEDRGSAERLFLEHLSGWGATPHLYRYPNSDWGADEAACQNTRGAGYDILPVTLDLDDFRYGEMYHTVARDSVAGRSSIEAQAVAELFFEAQERRMSEIKARRVRLRTPADQPEVLIIHSTRFTRDWLPEVLDWYEARGVRWVAPSAADGVFAPQAHSCLPACKWDGTCR